MRNVCAACARPLKSKAIIRGGKPATAHVCKSPICKKYGQPQ